MAAMLMAGIAGIRNCIDPTLAGFGPLEEDIQSRRSEVKSLPTSLRDVLVALPNDHQFFLQESVFDERLIQEWIQSKRQEFLDIEALPHPYEVQLYFDL